MLHGTEKFFQVTSEPTFDDSELTIDELDFSFHELDEKYISLKFQYPRLKRENDLLIGKLNVVPKEKEDISISFEKTKKDFNLYKIACMGKSSMISIESNDFEVLKKRTDVLDFTLKVCASNKSKIESLFSEKQISHHSKHAYQAQHTHHYAYMYAVLSRRKAQCKAQKSLMCARRKAQVRRCTSL